MFKKLYTAVKQDPDYISFIAVMAGGMAGMGICMATQSGTAATCCALILYTASMALFIHLHKLAKMRA